MRASITNPASVLTGSGMFVRGAAAPVPRLPPPEEDPAPRLEDEKHFHDQEVAGEVGRLRSVQDHGQPDGLCAFCCGNAILLVAGAVRGQTLQPQE